MSRFEKRAASGVVTTVLGYTTTAALWILLSDRAMGLLFSSPEALVRASMVKGWFFVGVTSLLLYALVHRLTAALTDAHRRELAFERERQQPRPCWRPSPKPPPMPSSPRTRRAAICC